MIQTRESGQQARKHYSLTRFESRIFDCCFTLCNCQDVDLRKTLNLDDCLGGPTQMATLDPTQFEGPLSLSFQVNVTCRHCSFMWIPAALVRLTTYAPLGSSRRHLRAGTRCVRPHPDPPYAQMPDPARRLLRLRPKTVSLAWAGARSTVCMHPDRCLSWISCSDLRIPVLTHFPPLHSWLRLCRLLCITHGLMLPS